MRITRLFTLAVPFAALGLTVGWLLGWSPGTKPGLVYDTAEVTSGPIRRVVTTSGPVRALVTVSVGSQLSGQIEQVKGDFNREVKPGDILATIDAKTFHARVAQSRADLAAAEAALVNQEAALKRAEAQLLLAEQNIERQRTLSAKGFASRATLDTAARDSEIGRADVAVAKAQIVSAKAVIAQRKASLDQAQIDLERTEIRSPIEGTVISRTVDPGQTVAASLQAPELFKIAQDLSRIRIEAQVNEADVGSIAAGNATTFTVDAYPDRQFDGTVTQVRLAATEINNVVTYTVIIEATNDDRKLFPGMTANVTIETAKRDGVLRVANDAFRYRPKGETAQSGRGERGGARTDRMVQRMKDELQLTADQETALRDAMTKLGEEMRAQQGGGIGGGQADASVSRQRFSARAEQVLLPMLSEAQRPLFDKWKQGRETVRPAALWVLTAGGEPDRRSVRTGVSDEQFTEIVGGDVKPGDRIVVRAREAKP
ncbi:MAG: efflux RND transporter periplasmic adaptor subunit [Hyphomicrobium sp.]